MGTSRRNKGNVELGADVTRPTPHTLQAKPYTQTLNPKPTPMLSSSMSDAAHRHRDTETHRSGAMQQDTQTSVKLSKHQKPRTVRGFRLFLNPRPPPEPTPVGSGKAHARGFRKRGCRNPRRAWVPALPEPTRRAGTHVPRGFRLCRNPRAPPEPIAGVGSGFAGTHAPCRNPRPSPEPTPPVGSGLAGTHALRRNPRRTWVPAVPEPTRGAGTHAGRGFRLCRNPRPLPEPTPDVGSGVAGTHVPCRNPRRAWVPALPEPTSRVLGTHGVFRVSFSRVMLAYGPRFLVF